MSAEFLAAWKRGVALAGPHFFGNPADPAAATSKNELRPDYDLVSDAMGYLSSGEAVFLACMFSFFNDYEGAKMLDALRAGSPCGVAASMDGPRLRVIIDLMASYEGW